MKKYKNYFYAILALVLMIVFDQFTKLLALDKLKGKPSYKVIPDVLHFYYVTNDGAAWGMFSNQQWLFILITVLMLLFIIFFYIKTPKTKKYLPLLCTLVLLAAGAIGNFIDRIANGYVHDFIYFVPIDFPVFNVADIYVTVSAFLLVILILFVYKDDNDFDYLKIGKKD